MPSNPEPLRIAFPGCGFIAGVHGRHVRVLRRELTPSCASRRIRRLMAHQYLSAEHTGQ